MSKNQLKTIGTAEARPIECFNKETHESIGKFESCKQAAQALYKNPQKAKQILSKIDNAKAKSWSKVKECYFYIKSLKS